MQSKLRGFSEHPCCARSVLDFTPNTQAFPVRLRIIDNAIHTCKHKDTLLNALTVFCLISTQPEHCFPHIRKGYFHVSQFKIDTIQEGSSLFGSIGVAAFLHRVLVGAEVSTVKFKMHHRIIRLLPATEHYHFSSFTKELFPDKGTKAALSHPKGIKPLIV